MKVRHLPLNWDISGDWIKSQIGCACVCSGSSVASTRRSDFMVIGIPLYLDFDSRTHPIPHRLQILMTFSQRQSMHSSSCCTREHITYSHRIFVRHSLASLVKHATRIFSARSPAIIVRCDCEQFRTDNDSRTTYGCAYHLNCVAIFPRPNQ